VGVTPQWPQLDAVVSHAHALEGLEVWLFGSAINRADPDDIDVLLVYDDREKVLALRGAEPWDEFCPPCSFIAMTRNELKEYDFIATTGAVRVV
jgi:hypothetical protein